MERLTKENYTIRVRQYIVHKKVLSKFCTHYQKMEVAKSMRSIYSLAKMVQRSCKEYDMITICKMVIANEQHLRNILPRQQHKHYSKQLEKLEQLILIAKNYKNAHN